ncbi:MAG: hypothetical protein Q9227_003933 [Pyrenula ochraceoflavens]
MVDSRPSRRPVEISRALPGPNLARTKELEWPNSLKGLKIRRHHPDGTATKIRAGYQTWLRVDGVKPAEGSTHSRRQRYHADAKLRTSLITVEEKECFDTAIQQCFQSENQEAALQDYFLCQIDNNSPSLPAMVRLLDPVFKIASLLRGDYVIYSADTQQDPRGNDLISANLWKQFFLEERQQWHQRTRAPRSRSETSRNKRNNAEKTTESVNDGPGRDAGDSGQDNGRPGSRQSASKDGGEPSDSGDSDDSDDADYRDVADDRGDGESTENEVSDSDAEGEEVQNAGPSAIASEPMSISTDSGDDGDEVAQSKQPHAPTGDEVLQDNNINVYPRGKTWYDSDEEVTEPKAIQWRTAIAKSEFKKASQLMCFNWGRLRKHSNTCLVLTADWRKLAPHEITDLLTKEEPKPFYGFAETASGKSAGMFKRLSYKENDWNTSFGRARCWFLSPEWPHNGERIDLMLKQVGPQFHASHLCHQPFCVNENHFVFEPAQVNHDRKNCYSAAVYARKARRPIEEECGVHVPLCKTQIAALTQLEAICIQFYIA